MRVKHISLIFLAGAIFQQISAQTTKQVKAGKIDYMVTQRYGLYIPGKPDGVDTASLYFNDTSSVYIIRQPPFPKEAVMKQLGGLRPEYRQEALESIMHRVEKNMNIYYYHKGGTDIISHPWEDPLGEKSYCVFDSIPSFTWELVADTARILGFLCQKAVFKSKAYGNSERSFSAWFTPDIALAYGPFRFFGLPGMILELENKYFNYKAVSINFPLPVEGVLAIGCCRGLPSISKKQADIVTDKQRKDFINMQKLNNSGIDH